MKSRKPEAQRLRNLGHERAALAKLAKEVEAPHIVNARQFAFSILVTGSQNGAARELMAWNNLVPPSDTDLYNSLKEMSHAIIEMARKSCLTARQELIDQGEPITISFDGAWDHRRNGSHCLNSAIAQKTKKVIHFAVVGKKYDKRQSDYCAVSQNMEVAALKLMLPELMEIPLITGYCHDKDSRTTSAIKDSGWTIGQFLDPNHALKSFDRTADKWSKKNGKFLDDIIPSLRKFIRWLIGTSTHSLSEKKTYWANCVKHFCGDHTGCPFIHTKEIPVWSGAAKKGSVELLREFVQKTMVNLDIVMSQFSTQANESLNRTKLKYANKDVAWGFTWKARMACAILDRNQPFWKLDLYKELGLPPLCDEVILYLQNVERQRLNQKFYFTSEKYREDRRTIRKLVKLLGAEKKPPTKPHTKTLYKGKPPSWLRKDEAKK
jgi:hypothetical protein